jgi:hypothetical protein
MDTSPVMEGHSESLLIAAAPPYDKHAGSTIEQFARHHQKDADNYLFREGKARNPFGNRKADCGSDEKQAAENEDYTDEFANDREYHQSLFPLPCLALSQTRAVHVGQQNNADARCDEKSPKNKELPCLAASPRDKHTRDPNERTQNAKGEMCLQTQGSVSPTAVQ